MDLKSNDVVILTGAGFTKNFGGFLGWEMWGQLFNDPIIDSVPTVKRLLRGNFDFESAYSQIMEKDQYGDQEKTAIKIAINNAYSRLDDNIRGWTLNDRNPHVIDWGEFTRTLNLITQGGAKGLFFTLNQDLFLERRCGVRAPGISYFPNEFYRSPQVDFKPEFSVALDSENIEQAILEDIQKHSGYAYIKLHGSFGWTKPGDPMAMAIGHHKSAWINKEPLLNAYFNLFKNTLHAGNKTLVIMGYGFGDHHINEVLVDAVEQSNLKLVIITTSKPEEFYFKMARKHNGLRIRDGMINYLPYSLKQIYPYRHNGLTEHAKKLNKIISSNL